MDKRPNNDLQKKIRRNQDKFEDINVGNQNP